MLKRRSANIEDAIHRPVGPFLADVVVDTFQIVQSFLIGNHSSFSYLGLVGLL
jgi:hypothetical protein